MEGEEFTNGCNLASRRITIAMECSVFQFRIVLSDETPDEEEPTMSLRVHAMAVDAGLDPSRDMREVHTLCPADLHYCSKHNPYLRRHVWADVFDMESPCWLPLLLTLEPV